jgi:hypothetical protein
VRIGPTLREQGFVHLQGLGTYRGTPAGDVQPGDRLFWNWGYRSRVLGVERRGKSVVFTLEEESGSIVQRRMLASSLVVAIRKEV